MLLVCDDTFRLIPNHKMDWRHLIIKLMLENEISHQHYADALYLLQQHIYKIQKTIIFHILRK